MTRHIAISALGKDRPGIVAALSRVLFEEGCNIEDSSMTLLRGEFATILMVELPDDLTVAQLRRRITPTAAKLGLTFTVRPLTISEDARQKPQGPHYAIAVYGADKPGIVFGTTAFLARCKINITDVQTSISRGTSGPSYVMFLEVDIPSSVSAASLKLQLSSLAKKLKVTITLNRVDSPQL